MIRGTVALIVATIVMAGSLIVGAMTTFPASGKVNQITEHSCSAPAQCKALAKRYPHDDVILKITEDDPRWNCLTMGNHRCGPGYVMVDDTAYPQVWIGMLTDAGEDPYRCLVNVADTTTVVCQDGYVTTS